MMYFIPLPGLTFQGSTKPNFKKFRRTPDLYSSSQTPVFSALTASQGMTTARLALCLHPLTIFFSTLTTAFPAQMFPLGKENDGKAAVKL